jgi:sterol 3beta-glucosyltransferase
MIIINPGLFNQPVRKRGAMPGNTKKVVIPTVGTRGDVQPYIALALGLNEAGFETTIASHPVMEDLVVSYGAKFKPMGPDVDIGKEAATIRAKSYNWLVGLMRVMQFTVSVVEQSQDDLLKMCEQADLVVVSHSFAGRAEADKLGLPVVSVTLQPQAIPAKDPDQTFIKRLGGTAASAVFAPMMVRPYNRIRRKLGVPSIKNLEDMMSPDLNLVPLSPIVTPPDPNWKPQHKVVGYWFLEEPLDWSPPEALTHYLGGGGPPVLINLGAMSTGVEESVETAGIFLDSLKETGLRAIIQGWDEVMSGMELPPQVCHAGSIPHNWLLPHVCCLVHHGGFGTTASGLRAGIPSLVIPHIIDQFYWGQRVFELGAGPKPIPRKELSVEKLSTALLQAARDEELRAGAAKIGSQIKAEDGISSAVRMVQEFVITK